MVGFAVSVGSVAAGPEAAVAEEQDGLSGGTGEESGAAAHVDDDARCVAYDTADVSPQCDHCGFGAADGVTVLGVADHLVVAGSVEGTA